MASSLSGSFDPRSGAVGSPRASSRLSPGEMSLGVRLAAEMARRWSDGDRPLAEDFLGEHPELWEQPEAAVDLVYEEICLRQEAGEEGAEERVLGRFPQWRAQLEMLLECHRILDPERTAPRFPQAGEAFGDCRLLAELGRGAQGRVFLAVQPALADRPVVLKLTPGDGQEHLSLGRLYHTNIVPLYHVWEDPGRHLRVLCMPYFGGSTLARLLDRLHDLAPEERTGAALLRALDQAAGPAPPATPAHSPARHYYARYSYVRAVCWLVACVADALQYAHERGLVHLDVKPSNVLLAADGTPMLLDFHLAHSPVRPGGPTPEWLGGTPVYMAPEQRVAVRALSEGRPIPAAVEAAADIFALGLLLYEALGGPVPAPEGRPRPRLERLNPAVGTGLADLIARCLEEDPGRRYRTAADVAGDLRRHIADRPLLGVHNCLGERLGKWRRRDPGGLRRIAWACTAGVVAALAVGMAVVFQGERQEAATETAQARAAADHARAVHELHLLATRLRFGSADPQLSPGGAELDAGCASVWDRREAILDHLEAEPDPERDAIRTDLLDLALLWADLRTSRASPDDLAATRREAAAVVEEARQCLGLGPPDAEDPPEPTAAEHYARGRARYHAGDLERADAEFRAAVRLNPRDLWSHYYHGICAYRGKRYEDAALAFTACAALAPEFEQTAQHLYNRAKALAALGRTDQALADYGLALEYDPGLAVAALNRGILHYQVGHYREALADLHLAEERGANPASVCFNRAVIQNARGDREGALANLERALAHDPRNAAARRLRDRLRPVR
jgi:tetratricopeptide (TPR) repeat protein